MLSLMPVNILNPIHKEGGYSSAMMMNLKSLQMMMMRELVHY